MKRKWKKTYVCRHGSSGLSESLLELMEDQSGEGRHKCPTCAYAKGFENGLNGVPLPENRCQHGCRAPKELAKTLRKSQAGPGRHKCVYCAYVYGYHDAEKIDKNALEALETMSLTHGNFDIEYEPEAEGKQRIVTHIAYERSRRNRGQAIQIHGTKCMACGFDFDKVYGADFARHYIEIHHVESIATIKGQTVDPQKDLVALCSNCHSMAHRDPKRILSVDDLQTLIKDAEAKKENTNG